MSKLKIVSFDLFLLIFTKNMASSTRVRINMAPDVIEW